MSMPPLLKKSTLVLDSLPTDPDELAKLKESLRGDAFIYTKDGDSSDGSGSGGSCDCSFQKVITEPTTFYVATMGEDTLDEGRGLTADKPFKTLQFALRHVLDNYIISANVTIHLADGTYVLPSTLFIESYKRTNANFLLIVGTSKTGTIIQSTRTGGNFIDIRHWRADFSNITFDDTQASNASHGICAFRHSTLVFTDCVFKSPQPGHVLYAGSYSRISVNNCSFSTNLSSGNPMFANEKSILILQGTITMSGNGENCIAVSRGSFVEVSCTFSGSFTGRRYRAASGSKILTGGKGANFIPGTTAGLADTQTGALYY